MLRYQQGDLGAFRALFTRYSPRTYHYLLSRTGSQALAEDLAQQAWLRLHRARADYRPGAAFAPWFFTIVANLCRSSHRDRGREVLTTDGRVPEPPAPAAGLDGRAEAPDAAAGDAPDGEAVRRAVAALPEGYRDVILLHRYHEFSFAEIAGLLGTSEGAIKVRAHRAYVMLRELLGDGP